MKKPTTTKKLKNVVTLSMSIRVGPAFYDDAPPSAAHGAAACFRSHGDVTDEPPQHHCQHGCCSPADTH